MPIVSVALSGLAVALGSICLAFNLSGKIQAILSATVYILFAASTIFILSSTGYENSPFIALYIVVAILSGSLGITGLISIGLLVNGYILYILSGSDNNETNKIAGLIILANLPVYISYILWREKQGTSEPKLTAYNQLAAKLNDTASRSEVMINSIADGVIAINNQGHIELINPAAQIILGWKKEDALGLHFTSVLKLAGPNDQPFPPLANPVEQVLATNTPLINTQINLITKSEKKLLVALHVSPVTAQQAGVIIVFRDITIEKKEERQQAEFISTASHEMRTPVASIEGYIGLALNPQTANIDEKARTYLLKAHESAQHLGRLFQDLLDISKAEDGRLLQNPQVIDLNAFLTAITNDFEMKARAKGLVLQCKLSQNPDSLSAGAKNVSPVYYCYTDEGHLREVISNLIENAIKYTREGTVSVDVTGDENNVTASVTDSGVGIPPEDIPHLFQKFYRVDNTDTREIGGTGLGLYLSRRLVEFMNGRLWVSSELGQGSTFYVELPRLKHEEALERLEKSSVRSTGTSETNNA